MKGNLFLGYGRGSVGDVVFARTGGQQVGRARNRRPNNPRSVSQVSQRSLFADAVKFFSHGRQALFKFAFESKQPQESDYNAFMRYNAKNGIMLSKPMIDDNDFPAVGRWIMSQGSLPEVKVNTVLDADNIASYNIPLGVVATESLEQVTVARLTELLTATADYAQGDILTFVYIHSDAVVSEDGVVPISSGGSSPIWEIAQIVLDASDTRKVSVALNSQWINFQKDTQNRLSFTILAGFTPEDVGAVTAIHSRITPQGLKVSTQELRNSPGVIRALGQCSRQSYKDYILYTWGAADLAILEGSIGSGGRR